MPSFARQLAATIIVMMLSALSVEGAERMLLRAHEADPDRLADFLDSADIRQIRLHIDRAGLRIRDDETQYMKDFDGFIAGVETQDVPETGGETLGRRYVMYQRGLRVNGAPVILVSAYGKDKSDRPFFEYQFTDAALRFTYEGEEIHASLVPAENEAGNAAAALGRVGANAWTWATVQDCFFEALGIDNLTQFSGLVSAFCTLPSNVKSIVTATGHGLSCAAGGVVSCAIFAVYSLCGAAEIISCVNSTPPPPPDVRLVSGQTQNAQQVRLREWRYYWIDVPAGASLLRVVVSGSGDADLYTRQGSKPTSSTYACRPYRTNSEETCTHNNPSRGTWWVGIFGDNPATYSITATTTVPTFSISGAAGTGNAAISASSSSATFSQQATSTGSYAFSNLSAGTYTLRPTKANCTFSPATMSVTVGPSVTNRNFTANCSTPPPPPGTEVILSNGQQLTGRSVAAGAWQYFRIDLPSGRTRLQVTISGTGDADLYTRYASKPTTTSYACRPYTSSSNETCTMNNPAAGQWWIGVRGYSSATFSIRATYQ
jgi:hypothetical protein